MLIRRAQPGSFSQLIMLDTELTACAGARSWRGAAALPTAVPRGGGLPGGVAPGGVAGSAGGLAGSGAGGGDGDAAGRRIMT